VLQSMSETPKWFDRVLVMSFEDMDYQSVEKDSHWAALSATGVLFTKYVANAQSPQANHFCQVAGDPFSVTTENNVNISETSIVDLLTKAGLSWKSYQGDFPGNCFTGDIGRYKRSHNPFISFDHIRADSNLCSNIVPETQFGTDLASGKLPNYSFYSPNLDSSGDNAKHVSDAGLYARQFFDTNSKHIPYGTLIVVTWAQSGVSNNNMIYGFLLGSMITPATTDTTPYSHFSLLKTVEENWNLGNLGRGDSSSTVKIFSLPPYVPSGPEGPPISGFFEENATYIEIGFGIGFVGFVVLLIVAYLSSQTLRDRVKGLFCPPKEPEYIASDSGGEWTSSEENANNSDDAGQVSE